MINLAELVVEKLGIQKKDISIGDYIVPIIALTGDHKDLTQNAEDSYSAAIVYGLRDNLEALISSKKYEFEDILAIVESQGFTDDDMKVIAEEVLTISDLSELIEEPEEDITVIDSDNMTDEQLNAPIGSF
jgi:hypothetical protein